MQSTSTHALRLKPGEDLRIALQQFVNSHQIHAGWIMTCVGSLTQYNLRFANQQAGNKGDDFFEIVCLSGTLSISGCHLHMAVSDSTGAVIAGHLLEGCTIYTTAEIVIGTIPGLVFTREKDESTGFNELLITGKKDKS